MQGREIGTRLGRPWDNDFELNDLSLAKLEFLIQKHYNNIYLPVSRPVVNIKFRRQLGKMVKSSDWRARLPELKSQLCHLLAAWPWANNWTCASLRFLIWNRKNQRSHVRRLLWGLNGITHVQHLEWCLPSKWFGLCCLVVIIMWKNKKQKQSSKDTGALWHGPYPPAFC